MDINEIWIVTYWDKDVEPVVTAFNNKEVAEKCYKHFAGCHEGCCIDKCKVYSNFFLHKSI